MGRIPDCIELRHRAACPKRDDAAVRCRCRPSYRASVWSPRDQDTIRKTFPTLAAAKTWRTEAAAAVRRGQLAAGTGRTIREASTDLLAAMETGAARTRSGDAYKPSTIRGYRESMDRFILDDIGAIRLRDVGRRDIQGIVDRMRERGTSPSTIRNAVMPLRVIVRRAIREGDLFVSPLDHLDLPAVRGRRDRIASPEEAARLLAAVPDLDRPIWATAMYAGLRRGELRGLHVDDVDLAAGLLHVRRSWDVETATEVTPKSASGVRRIPIAAILRAHLAGHILSLGRRDGFMFPGRRSDRRPFSDSGLAKRARAAWTAAGEETLTPITLHECRHTFAAICIAAGINAKALSTYMGHSSIATTFDIYGHLMPGSEDEAAGLLDDLLGDGSPTAQESHR